MKNPHKCLAIASLAFLPILAVGQETPAASIRGEYADQVDAMFSAYGDETPGCAVAVDHSNEIVHLAGYGMADLEQSVPIGARSVFYAGSVSKQVVAMAAVLLDRQGAIDLDETVGGYLPDFPAYADTVTVRQTLHHTSGIRDFFVLYRLAGRLDGVVITEDGIMDILRQQRGLNFEPGERWAYSNSAYFLISQIVKAAEGRNLDAFAQDNIFGPLGMAQSHFQHNHRRLILQKAHGYEPQEDSGYLTADSTLDVVGSGGMYTTVGDLIRWDRNFYTNKLGGGQELIDEMETSAVLNSGELTEYGIALSLRPYKGLKRRSHGGALVGYRAMLQRFPDQKFTVALLCNSSEADPQSYANQITDIYLSGHFTDEPDTADNAAGHDDFEGSNLSLQGFQAFAGAYYSAEVDNTIRIVAEESGLRIFGVDLPDNVIAPHAVDAFRHVEFGFELAFDRAANGDVAGVTYNGPRVARLRFARPNR